MDKQEKVISKLDDILTEIRAGREEGTASMAVQPARKPMIRLLGRVIIILLVVSSGIGVGIWYTAGSNGKAESAVFIEEVHGLAKLATAEAHVKVILEQKDNALFGENINFNTWNEKGAAVNYPSNRSCRSGFTGNRTTRYEG